VGGSVLEDTLAQMALVANPTREGRALRNRFDVILGAHESLNRELAARLSGLATAYAPVHQDEHPLVGTRVPDLDLEAAPAPSVFGLLPTARFVLLDLTGGQLRFSGPDARADRLDVVSGRLSGQQPEWASVRALLIRPDGYVAWGTEDPDPDRAGEQARMVLERWLDPGPPCPPVRARHPTPTAAGRPCAVAS
jgi:hypothetical protein